MAPAPDETRQMHAENSAHLAILDTRLTDVVREVRAMQGEFAAMRNDVMKIVGGARVVAFLCSASVIAAIAGGLLAWVSNHSH